MTPDLKLMSKTMYMSPTQQVKKFWKYVQQPSYLQSSLATFASCHTSSLVAIGQDLVHAVGDLAWQLGLHFIMEMQSTYRSCTHAELIDMYTYMHACIHTYLHTYIHTYIHTDTHTYSCICACQCYCVICTQIQMHTHTLKHACVVNQRQQKQFGGGGEVCAEMSWGHWGQSICWAGMAPVVSQNTLSAQKEVCNEQRVQHPNKTLPMIGARGWGRKTGPKIGG